MYGSVDVAFNNKQIGEVPKIDRDTGEMRMEPRHMQVNIKRDERTEVRLHRTVLVQG